ncbi:MAG: hypothetical protein QX191_09565, partial [Methylococcaceae bacterium]
MILFTPLLVVFLLISSASHGDRLFPVIKDYLTLIKQINVIDIGEDQVNDSYRWPARIDLYQQHVARIGATVTGWIIKIEGGLDQEVHKG